MEVTEGSIKYPKGWYTLALAHELRPGQVEPKKLAGKNIVMFRTQSGKACVLDAYCTHLGAHLGYGGTVNGEVIKCPFHGFCFDSKGQNNNKICHLDSIYAWPVKEVNGLVVVYYGGESREKPNWEIPAYDLEGFSLYPKYQWTLSTQVQEIIENGYDLRHLQVLHGYHAMNIIEDFKPQDHLTSINYKLIEPLKVLGLSKTINIDISITSWGMGFQRVQTTFQGYNMVTQHFFLATPIEGNRVEVRVVYYANEDQKSNEAGNLLSKVFSKMIKKIVIQVMRRKIAQAFNEDFIIWETKTYPQNPCLAKDEKRILEFREWARQFY